MDRFHPFDFALWTPWLPWVVGFVVTCTVAGFVALVGRRYQRRRRLSGASREEDLPWQDLLVLLEKRNQDRAQAGSPPEEAPEEVINQLMASLSTGSNRQPGLSPNDRQFLASGGADRRASHRRWGVPTDVHLHCSLWPDRVHGLVVNRSTGGLGIFADKEVLPGTPLQVRAAEAPSSVPGVRAEVRHCRKAGKGFFFGCEFSETVPWNARVWFG